MTALDSPQPTTTASIADADWVSNTTMGIWFAAMAATAVPVVGLGMAVTGDGTTPAWVVASLFLLVSLPAAALLIFILVLVACKVNKETWKASLGEAFAHSVGGFFGVLGAFISGM